MSAPITPDQWAAAQRALKNDGVDFATHLPDWHFTVDGPGWPPVPLTALDVLGRINGVHYCEVCGGGPGAHTIEQFPLTPPCCFGCPCGETRPADDPHPPTAPFIKGFGS